MVHCGTLVLVAALAWAPQDAGAPARGSVEFLLERIAQAQIEADLLNPARCELVAVPLGPQSASTQVHALPFLVDLEEPVVEVLSAGAPWASARPGVPGRAVLHRAFREETLADAPAFAGLPRSRDAEGFARVLVEQPGEYTIPVTTMGAEWFGQVWMRAGPGGINAALPEGITALPQVTARIAGEKVGTWTLDSRGMTDLRFTVPAGPRQQDVVLAFEHLVPGSGATTLFVHTLNLQATDGKDRLELEEPVPEDLVARYRPAVPAPLLPLEVPRGEGPGDALEREVLFLPGHAAVHSSMPQGFRVTVDGALVASVEKGREALFPVSGFGARQVRVESTSGKLAGDWWLVQPAALHARRPAVLRGQEEEPVRHPLVQHVELHDDTRRALLASADTRVRLPVEVQAGDRLELSVGVQDLGPRGWPSAAAILKVALVDAGGSEHVLFQETLRGERPWSRIRVPVPAVSGSLVFEVHGDESSGLLACRYLVALAEPRFLRFGEGPRPPNLLIYLIDTLRADHVSAYGAARPTTPRIDAFAAESVLFERAYAPAPWTRPAVASLFSGLHSMYHGAGKTTGLRPELVTLAERLRARGLETASFMANAHVHGSSLNFEQGFGEFVGVERKRGGSRSSDVNDLVFPWLERHADRPFFLYVHTIDPHAPYDPPPETAGRFGSGDYAGPLDPSLTYAPSLESVDPLTPEDLRYVLDLYDEEILFNDGEFGRLLDRLRELGIYDDTVILLVSDHGEEFHEHGGFGHGQRLWEELLRVPCILKLQGGEHGGTRVPDPVSLVDLFPTLLAHLGVELPPWTAQGTDLGPWIAGEAPGLLDVIAMEEPGHRCLVRGSVKVIEWFSGDPERRRLELYDLRADPGEQRDLATAKPEDAARWLREMQGVLEAFRERGFEAPADAPRQDLSPEELKALRELGYLDADDG